MPRKEPRANKDKWTRLWFGWRFNPLDRAWDIHARESLEHNTPQLLIVAAIIAAVLIGAVWLLGLRDDERIAQFRAEIELQHDFSVVNETGEIISLWVREDAAPPPSPGVSIAEFHSIGCDPPECGIRREATESFQVQRNSDDQNALMAINAWLSATGEIIYTNHVTQQELDGVGWRLTVTDQR